MKWNTRSTNEYFIRVTIFRCGSALFERLALSTDKDGVKQLAEKGHVVEKASYIVKDPYVLEFLGLEEKAKYSESELENNLIEVAGQNGESSDCIAHV